MDMTPPLETAIKLVGLQPLAKRLGVTYQAIRRWEKNGRLPRTEWTGETLYATTIEDATGGAVTKTALLAPWVPSVKAGEAPPQQEPA